jgi:glutamate 5-kinase
VVADGKPLHPLRAIEDGARCTWFLPRANPRAARKHWIAGILGPAGAITIDNGAMKALGNGKSLLPAGVTEVEGAFKRGDAVIVKAGDGRKIGRGLFGR